MKFKEIAGKPLMQRLALELVAEVPFRPDHGAAQFAQQ